MILAFSLGESVVNHFARRCVIQSDRHEEHGGPQITYNFPLPREQDEIAIKLLVQIERLSMSGRT